MSLDIVIQSSTLLSTSFLSLELFLCWRFMQCPHYFGYAQWSSQQFRIIQVIIYHSCIAQRFMIIIIKCKELKRHQSRFIQSNLFRFNENFSVYGLMDLIHGTSNHFLKSIDGEHHLTLFTFKPVRQYLDKQEEKTKHS